MGRSIVVLNTPKRSAAAFTSTAVHRDTAMRRGMHTAMKRRVFFAASRKAALWTTRIKFSNPVKVPSAIPVNAWAITAPKGISVNTAVPAALGARNRKAALFCEVKVRFALGVLRRLLQRQGSIKKSLRFRHNDI